MFFTACGTKSADFCYKIKNKTTDDDAPIDLVSVPRKRVYGGGQKNDICAIDLDSKDSDDAYQVLKGEDDGSLVKTLTRYIFCVYRISTTARLLFTNQSIRVHFIRQCMVLPWHYRRSAPQLMYLHLQLQQDL